MSVQQDKAAEPVSPLEKVGALGIDTQTGLYYCQKDGEFYKQLLMEYAKNGPGKIQDADRFFGNKDYPNYKIIVHAMKSTSKMIGATGLSEQARALEEAAKAEDGEYISAHHETVMAEFKKLIEGIAKAYEEQSKDEASGQNDDMEVLEFVPEESESDTEDGNDEILEFLPEED